MGEQEIQKKKEEKQYLKHFIMSFDAFPSGKVVEAESPDFLIKHNKKNSTGIEMTKLYMSNNDLHYSSGQINDIGIKIINESKELYISKNDLPISVHFEIAENINRYSNNITGIADKIVKLICEKVRDQNLNRFFRVKISESELPKDIISIQLIYHPDDKNLNWMYCKGKVTPEMFIGNIEGAIDKKEQKLRLYQKKILDRIWLIMLTDCLKCTTNFNIRNLIEKMSVNSNFDRIFLFEMYAAKIYTLK